MNHIHKAGIRRVQSDRWGHVFKKRSCRVEAAYLVKFCTGAGACICGFLVGLKCKVHPSISSCVSSKAEPNDMRPAPNGSVVENKFHLLNQPCNLTSYHPSVGCCPGISWGSSTISPINLYNVTLISLNKRVNCHAYQNPPHNHISTKSSDLEHQLYKDFVNLLSQEKFSLSTH